MASFDVIWPHSTRCPKSYQELVLTCWCMFLQGLVVIESFFTYLWLPTYIPSLPRFLLTSRGPAHPLLYLIANLQIAITFEHPLHINDPSLENYEVAVYGFLFLCFRCLYQTIHESVSQTFMYTQSAYLSVSLCHCCLFISLILFLLVTSTCYKEIA